MRMVKVCMYLLHSKVNSKKRSILKLYSTPTLCLWLCQRFTFVRTALIILAVLVFLIYFLPEFAEAGQGEGQSDDVRVQRNTGDGPTIADSRLKIEEIAEGLNLPTSIAFLGTNDILVLEKQNGAVKRVVDGRLLSQPLLDVSVANENERGMLGIAIKQEIEGSSDPNRKTFVYISFTESTEEGSDECSTSNTCEEQGYFVSNRLYRYELLNNQLVSPQLLLDLPATPGPAHNGGALTIGPDGNIYHIIGDVRGSSQNPKGSNNSFDGRAGILRITPDGQPVGNGILGSEHPLNFYYAYGIRNSFGMDFDPVTGNLWDTENGPLEDEINLVEPGFNSGWKVIHGMLQGDVDTSELENFRGQGQYSDPEFVWHKGVGPTALTFLDSNNLGQEYQNDMFIGDVHRGNIYHFELDDDREELILDGPLEDKVADDDEDLEEIIFGENFGGITDIEVGPDGYLYIVSIGLGKIFRIVPETTG